MHGRATRRIDTHINPHILLSLVGVESVGLNPGVGWWSENWKSSARARKPLTQEHGVRTHRDPCCAIAKKVLEDKECQVSRQASKHQNPPSIGQHQVSARKHPNPPTVGEYSANKRGAKFNSKTEEMLFGHKSHSREFPQREHQLLWKGGLQFFNYVVPMCLHLLHIRLVLLLPQSPSYILGILQGQWV